MQLLWGLWLIVGFYVGTTKVWEVFPRKGWTQSGPYGCGSGRELRPIHRCWIQQCAVSGVQPFPRYITHFCSSMLHFCMDESCSIWSCNCLSLFSQWPSPKIKDMYSYSCLCLSPGLKAVLAEAEKTLRVTPDTTASGLAITCWQSSCFGAALCCQDVLVDLRAASVKRDGVSTNHAIPVATPSNLEAHYEDGWLWWANSQRHPFVFK